MSIAFNKKKHDSRELFQLKNSIYKGKCETFTNWKSKRRYQQTNFVEHFGSRSFILDLWYQQRCDDIVEIRDIKCGLLSKYLLQKTQQYGGCTKPLGNDKFVEKMSPSYQME